MSGHYGGSGRGNDDDRGGGHRAGRGASPERRSRSEYDSRQDRAGGGSRDRDRHERSGDRSRDDWNERERDRGGDYSRKRYRDLDDEGRDSQRARGDYRGDERDRSSRGGGRDYREERGREWSPQRSQRRGEDSDFGVPCSTLVIRGLAESIAEDDIAANLSRFGSVGSVRIARDRDTGAHRGTAFADFSSTEGAQNAMESLGGYLTAGADEREYKLEYSREARGGTGGRSGADWICTSCRTVNFARRSACFKCSVARPPDAKLVDHSTPSSDGTDLVMIRGIASNSTDDSVQSALLPYLTTPLKMIKVVRDPVTRQSRGVAFIDVGDVKSSAALIKASAGLLIDGSEVNLAFARPKDVSAALSGQASLKANPFGATAVEQAMSHIQQRVTPSNVPEGFVYDERSGWYYHATTGYYFDPSTNLYYEPTQSKYYFYDQESASYVEHQAAKDSSAAEVDDTPTESVAQQSAAQAAAQAAASMAEFGKKKKKIATAKAATGASGTSITAMKINLSSEIGKWKAQQDDVVLAREAVEVEKPSQRVGLSKQAEVQSTSTAGGWSGDGVGGGHVAPAPAAPAPAPAPAAPTVAAAAAAGGGAVCLLCRRKFGSAEQLAKHEQQSEMHRQKVEEAKRAQISEIKKDVHKAAVIQEKKVDKLLRRQDYSQQAKEEREAHKALKEAEEAARLGIDLKKAKDGPDANNKGTMMMKMMGWTDGSGLGSTGQGVTSHVSVVHREERAGIGCGEVTKEEDMILPSDDYKTRVIKKASSRYEKEEDPTAWRQSFSQGD